MKAEINGHYFYESMTQRLESSFAYPGQLHIKIRDHVSDNLSGDIKLTGEKQHGYRIVFRV